MVTRITPRKPVKQFLKEWRLSRGLTQQQLADRLPVGEDGRPAGKDLISRWERGERDMTMKVQVALAEALGLGGNPGKLFQDPSLQSIDDLVSRTAPERRHEIFAAVEDMLRVGGNT